MHCWGTQQDETENLTVRGDEPQPQVTGETKEKFKAAVDAMALNLQVQKELGAIDLVHTHTWYVSMAGFLAKKLYGVPFVLTDTLAEPLRAWKAEQLGSGYAMSSWMEKTAIEDADAIVAVFKRHQGRHPEGLSGCGSGEDPRHLQRDRPEGVPADAGDGRAGQVWCRPPPAVRAVCGPHHAAKGV